MLTAKTEEIDKVLGLELGADDYITKPFSIREFSQPREGRAAARRPSPSREAQFEEPIDAGDLQIDFEKRSVDGARGAAQLTYVEFEILAALARAPGRVFSRTMLLERVWGDAAYRDPRTIDVHIRHLREKLEAEPKTPELILTVAAWATGSGTHEQRCARSATRSRSSSSLVTAAAFTVIWFVVVPQLESEPEAAAARRPCGDEVRSHAPRARAADGGRTPAERASSSPTRSARAEDATNARVTVRDWQRHCDRRSGSRGFYPVDDSRGSASRSTMRPRAPRGPEPARPARLRDASAASRSA